MIFGFVQRIKKKIEILLYFCLAKVYNEVTVKIVRT